MRTQVHRVQSPNTGRGVRRDVAEFMRFMGLDDDRRLAYLRLLSPLWHGPRQCRMLRGYKVGGQWRGAWNGYSPRALPPVLGLQSIWDLVVRKL